MTTPDGVAQDYLYDAADRDRLQQIAMDANGTLANGASKQVQVFNYNTMGNSMQNTDYATESRSQFFSHWLGVLQASVFPGMRSRVLDTHKGEFWTPIKLGKHYLEAPLMRGFFFETHGQQLAVGKPRFLV